MHKKQIIRIVIAAIVVVGYLAALRFVLPVQQPYFILGIGVVAFVAWFCGILPGLAAAVFLIPGTHYVYEQQSAAVPYAMFLNSVAYLGLTFLSAIALGVIHNISRALAKKDEVLRETNKHLQESLLHVKELGGLHSMCGECKKILTDEGVWQNIDLFLYEHTKMEFSHGICTECAQHYHAPAAENHKA